MDVEITHCKVRLDLEEGSTCRREGELLRVNKVIPSVINEVATRRVVICEH
jgi:hypothetical protein